MCQNGILYYLYWKGTEPGYKKLRPGNLVKIYYTYSQGTNLEVFAFEEIHGNEETHPEQTESA